ncbi:hypothetical protein EDB82DRAFT_91127 [Fusarium venenatum]|uniref:uncharacterized protein n=1 Tax=Fusarium venenatum TaxID=56646 RepID=UPI001DF57959|nr:hypothetical protein EDB82DRAFT_91127 [Fusarium venenatum]
MDSRTSRRKPKLLLVIRVMTVQSLMLTYTHTIKFTEPNNHGSFDHYRERHGPPESRYLLLERSQVLLVRISVKPCFWAETCCRGKPTRFTLGMEEESKARKCASIIDKWH